MVDSATGAAVQGHPAEALALAANDLGRRGLAIEPGWIVLTGGMTDAVAVPRGAMLAAHFTHLGSIFLPEADASPPEDRQCRNAWEAEVPLVEITLVEGRTPARHPLADQRASPGRRARTGCATGHRPRYRPRSTAHALGRGRRHDHRAAGSAGAGVTL